MGVRIRVDILYDVLSRSGKVASVRSEAHVGTESDVKCMMKSDNSFTHVYGRSVDERLLFIVLKQGKTTQEYHKCNSNLSLAKSMGA